MHHSLRRHLIARAGAAAILAALSCAPALAQESPVVATVNGEQITEADLALAETELGPQFGQMPEDQRRAAALSAVIDVRLFAAEAEKEGIDQSEDFQRRAEFLRRRALHSAYIDENVVKPISEEELRARYQEEIAKIPAQEEVHARHILVPTEDEAKAIIEQLDEGGDFAAIAKEKSKDGAAANGGDLGYFTADAMVPEFSQAAFAMEPGSYSKEPVKTQFGWHVIKVEDKRMQEPPAFEQVQDQIRSLVVRDKYMDTLASLREGAEVEIPNADLKNAVDGMLRQQLGQDDPAAAGQQAPADAEQPETPAQ
ncbi:peptidylprolyl isomerase [Chelativorans sp. AA-79]|uniref:peptidylprolyl isomerase n=1 Tax=Chelativorans sp. AA-79 TaxID=3028735 RepID=UPI0023F73A22|nr:peptidylprolyl isomerase [Chelativorans sp. AA-79]WEX09019.1 peptidylprolyl isomerase [Chelativorans sp. AA-79]